MKAKWAVYLVAVAALCAVSFAFTETGAVAAPCKSDFYTYYSDAEHTDLVGQGETGCTTGTFHMIWGIQTGYFDKEGYPCSGGADCQSDADCKVLSQGSGQKCCAGACGYCSC